MKDLKDYFTSPPKAKTSSKTTNSSEPKEENKVVGSSQEATKGASKLKRKKKRRKPTDPEVRNVTELLSDNLNLVSPNSNVSNISTPPNKNEQKPRKSKTNDKATVKNSSSSGVSSVGKDTNSLIENVDVKNDDNKSNSEEPEIVLSISDDSVQKENIISVSESTPKLNAFQFLMNSRNNIIGQNSDGSIQKEQHDLNSEDKQKLESRKNLFKSWADKKGASKRKREEEEVEKCINLKMEKRAKRLKKLVQGVGKKQTSGDSLEKNDGKGLEKGKKASRKKVKKLSSTESESSCDINVSDKETTVSVTCTALTKVTEVLDENAQDLIISKDSLLSPIKKKHTQNSLLNFLGVSNSLEKQKDIVVLDESPKPPEKEIIKIKMFTPQSTKNRKNHSKSLEVLSNDDSSQGSKIKKHKRKKHKPKDKDESPQNKAKLNDSLEDFCSPVKHKKKKHKTEYSSKDLDDGPEIETISNNSSEDFHPPRNQKHSKNSSHKNDEHKKKHKAMKKNSDEIAVDNKGNLNPKNDAHKTKEGSVEAADTVDMCESTNDSDVVLHNPKKKRKYIIEDEVSLDIEADSDVLEVKNEGRSLRKRSVVNYKESLKIEVPIRSSSKSKVSSEKKYEKDESVEEIKVSSDSDSEETCKKKTKAPLKVAPVFLKSTPKPKLDPTVVEARKKFLLSGVPSSLKKTVEKQKCYEEREYDVFPTVSHVQQKCESKFWNLPTPNLNITTIQHVPLSIDNDILKCQNLIIKSLPYEVNLSVEVEKVKHLKGFLQKLKTQNPEYPVFKVFRHIYEKSGKKFLNNKPSNKKSPRRKSKKAQRKSLENENNESTKDFEMWTEKYRPRSSEEILGNYNSVKELKKWLETWMNYSEEINVRKRRRKDSNSESEFESTDCDSRDSTRLPGNTMILYGPCGSGKTSAIYAIANELNFNVLELNASTKRTGKILLQELQEATQSHQVRKNPASSLSAFISPNNKVNKDQHPNSEGKTKKMCILLLEDIDLIFDQDEGFLSSLSQLIMTSKRPIILTTTDNSPPHVQRFISQYECIPFMPLSLQNLGIWLQILCLVEGILVDKDDLGNLLEYNKGDIRKTVLEVQFWCQSGGQLEKDRIFPLKAECSDESTLKVENDDELQSIDFNEADEKCDSDQFIHKNCLGSFKVLRVNEEYRIPENVDLGALWWNFHNLLQVPSGALRRHNSQKTNNKEEQSFPPLDNDKNKLQPVSTLYDALILSDSLFKSAKSVNSPDEPVVRCHSVDLLNSLELTERKEDSYGALWDVAQELSHSLVNGCVKNCNNEATDCGLNMALPDSNERRWRANQHMCETFLKGGVPTSSILDRKSVAVDYLPALRDIARFEEKRAESNTKRGNRFRHYLKDMNIDFNPNTCKLACNILNSG